MPARETNEHYYVRRLEAHLPDSVGEPLVTPTVNDFPIVSDSSYFGDIAERVKAAYELDLDKPTLPGLEPESINPIELRRKQNAAVAIARQREGAGAVMQVIVTTFNQDTSGALWWYQKHGELIPVLEDDTPDNLYTRTLDHVDQLFVAAALARVVPSQTTREKGEAGLKEKFKAREDEAVFPLSTFVCRNSARMREVWLEQLEVTTKGYKYLPTAAKKELLAYIEQRPDKFMMKPDMHSVLASLHPKNTGRFRKRA